MDSVDFTTLPLSSKARIIWGFIWRFILNSLVAMVVAGLLGALIGFFVAVSGLTQSTVVTATLGAVTGLCVQIFFLYFYVRWLLSSRLGTYRLKLVHADDEQISANAVQG